MDHYTYGFTPKNAGYTVYATADRSSSRSRSSRSSSDASLWIDLIFALLFGNMGRRRYRRY